MKMIIMETRHQLMRRLVLRHLSDNIVLSAQECYQIIMNVVVNHEYEPTNEKEVEEVFQYFVEMGIVTKCGRSGLTRQGEKLSHYRLI